MKRSPFLLKPSVMETVVAEQHTLVVRPSLQEPCLASFGGGFGGEKFFAVGNQAFLLGRRHGEYGASSGRKLVKGEGVSSKQFLFPFGGAEDSPAFNGDPVDAGR